MTSGVAPSGIDLQGLLKLIKLRNEQLVQLAGNLETLIGIERTRAMTLDNIRHFLGEVGGLISLGDSSADQLPPEEAQSKS